MKKTILETVESTMAGLRAVNGGLMREVKFRALNSDNELIYGLPYTDGVNETTYYKEFNNRMCWRNEDGAHCNQPYKNGTLMQYTGLKDKSGTEIYEGDIVITEQPEIRDDCDTWVRTDWGNAVVSITPESGVTMKTDGGDYWSWDDDATVMHIRFIEIIGNIYENPELLEDK